MKPPLMVVEKVKELKDKGLTVAEISKKLQFREETVRQILESETDPFQNLWERWENNQ